MGALTAGTDATALLARLAQSAADGIVESAIRVDATASWLTATAEGHGAQRRIWQRTGDPTLYDGSAGIAWAGALAASTLGRTDLATVAVQAARHAVDERTMPATPGLHDGVAGCALAALAVGTWLDETALAARGRQLLDLAAGATHHRNDLIAGRAGVALGLVRAAELTGDDHWLARALTLSDALAGAAARRPWGWAWPDSSDDPGLCGTAHGVAGIVWVLSEVASASSTSRYDEAIAAGCQYERSWFDPTRNNWPDLRTDPTLTDGAGRSVRPVVPQQPSYPSLWCHGGAGIGMTRLAMHRLEPSPALVAEAAAAIQSSYGTATDELSCGRPPYGLTVCHGLGGTLELLLDAHATLGEVEHLDVARSLARWAVAGLGDQVECWPSGFGTVTSAGLMNGLAGVMLVLARLADPGRLGSVGLLAASAPQRVAVLSERWCA